MECTHLHCFILLFTLVKLLIIILLFISEGFFWFLLQQCCRWSVYTQVFVYIWNWILQVFVYLKLYILCATLLHLSIWKKLKCNSSEVLRDPEPPGYRTCQSSVPQYCLMKRFSERSRFEPGTFMPVVRRSIHYTRGHPHTDACMERHIIHA